MPLKTKKESGEELVLELWEVWSHSFITITPRSTPTLNRSVLKLSVLDKNISNHIIVLTNYYYYYYYYYSIFISDILLWTPAHGRAKAGQPARTYIQQLSADTGCNLEDLPGAMDDREGWSVREIRAGSVT